MAYREDSKTAIHHKVATCVLRALNEQDAQATARAEQQQLAQDTPGYTLSSHYQNVTSAAGPSNAFNFSSQGPAVGSQHCPATQPQGLVDMGSMRLPGQSTLTFNHIFDRL